MWLYISCLYIMSLNVSSPASAWNPVSPPNAEDIMHETWEALQQASEIMEDSVMPVIRKKYLIALIALGLTMFLLPEFVVADFLPISYLALWLIFIATFGLRSDRRFRKINKKLRPFVMTRYMEYLAIWFGVGLLIETWATVWADPSLLVPYLFLRWIYGVAVYQYVSIFNAAHRAKEDNPMRCEFC